MDSELNEVKLGWNNYLVIEKNSYKVITRDESNLPHLKETIVNESDSDDESPPPLIPVDNDNNNTNIDADDSINNNANDTTSASDPNEETIIETSDGDDGVIISHTPNPSDETINL